MRRHVTIAWVGLGTGLAAFSLGLGSCVVPTEPARAVAQGFTSLKIGDSLGRLPDHLDVGDTLQLVAFPADFQGQRLQVPLPPLAWSSSTPEVATVRSDGLVAAWAEGYADITAKAPGHEWRWTARVGPVVAAVSVTPSSNDVLLSGAVQLSALPRDGRGNRIHSTSRTVWTVADSTVARVDTNGTVTGLSVGRTTVSAAIETRQGSAVISVITVKFQAVVAGGTESCGLTIAGAAYCWGTSSPSRVPFATPFVSLSAGAYKTCGMTASPQAHCWTAPGPYAVPPALVSGVSPTAMTNGRGHDCGLTVGGKPYCWGANESGQLGAQTSQICGGGGKFGSPYPCSLTPIPVEGALVFTSLDAGAYHTCGVADRLAYCWGNNYQGRLGDSSLTSSAHSTPNRVLSASPLAAVSAGADHTCGLDGLGVAYCWGLNESGQLGIGDTATRLRRAPTPVAGGLRFRSITAGDWHTCAVTVGFKAYCWGNNDSGQLGDGTSTMRPGPVPVLTEVEFEHLSAGATDLYARGATTCGRSVAGLVYCWGSRATGRADGISDQRPVLVPGQSPPSEP